MPAGKMEQARPYSVSVLNPLLECLKERGFPVERSLQGTQILPADTQSPARISLADMLTVYANAAKLVPDPAFAFETGRRYHLSDYDIFGFAILSAPTFGRALQLMSDYARAFDVPIGGTIVREGQFMTCKIVPELLPLEFSDLYQFIVNLQTGQMLTACRDLLGAEFTPSSLSLSYRHSRFDERHIHLPGCTVTFGAAETSLTISTSFLEHKIELHNAATHALLTQVCGKMLRELDSELGMAGGVRSLLVANLGRGMALADVCAKLGTTERSLRRKLAQEGTSYREIANHVRMSFALKFLRGRNPNIEAIAEALGFSDSTSFRRAFRRWHGRGPRQIEQDWTASCAIAG